MAKNLDIDDGLGGIYAYNDDVAGGKLKETGTTHWASPNTGATNESGFTALPGGRRYNYMAFNNIGSYGYWWRATESDAASAWYCYMGYGGSFARRYDTSKEVGFSVRLVKDKYK